MPSSRLAVALFLLSSCAGWENSTPTYVAPTAETPAPSSHYAPPPPVVPGEPTTDTPANPGDRVAIASVQLLDDCPDPAAEPEAERAIESRRKSEDSKRVAGSDRRRCEQSTVQLAVRSDRPGTFRIDAIRVLDGAGRGVAGTSKLRLPTHWASDVGGYQPWDQRVAADVDLKISYKLGDLEIVDANKLEGAEFNAYLGPFLLELDVSIDGRRQTIRSAQFWRPRMDLVET